MMTQKSLVYVVLAVAVGYILVSAVPQQVATFTNPQRMLTSGDGDMEIESAPESGDQFLAPSESLPSDDEVRELSLIEAAGLPDLMKWWTLDIIVAITVYWAARRRLA